MKLKHIILGIIISLNGCTSEKETKFNLFDPVQKQRTKEDFFASSEKGMVVAGHAMAAEAGAKMLKKGGNAIDAAVAASFVISVVRPHSSGLGGGGFLLSYNPSNQETHVVDFRERAPKAASPRMYIDRHGEYKKIYFKKQLVPNPAMNGHLAVATPGLVAGLLKTHKAYGKLTRSEVMADAIEIAKKGFLVYPTLANALQDRKSVLKLYPSSSKIFFKGDNPLNEGDLLVQTDLANTLQEISDNGEKSFYKGEIAKKILEEMKLGKGIIAAEDLTNYKVIERKPLESKYKGYTVLSMPPPSSGGVHIVQMLKILENDDLQKLGHNSAPYLHLLTEAMRRAFADRATYLGDPDFVKVPTDYLTSASYAKILRGSIRSDRASVSSEIRNPVESSKESSSTTHISVVDSEGLAVSTTQTINYNFGSCVVAEGTGIVLNDEMDDFSTNPGKPNVFGLIQGPNNQVEPLKTPLSSMSPTIVLDDAHQVKLVLGSPGGPKIITAVLQTFLNVIDFKMPLLPAVHSLRIHHQWMPDQLRIEKNGITKNVEVELKKLGHNVLETTSIGDVQAIVRLSPKKLEGVADSRAEGKAVGL